jgi:hypothetical protein
MACSQTTLLYTCSDSDSVQNNNHVYDYTQLSETYRFSLLLFFLVSKILNIKDVNQFLCFVSCVFKMSSIIMRGVHKV